MYGSDRIEENPEYKNRRALLIYLAHCNKPEHVKTVQYLLDRLAATEAQVGELRNRYERTEYRDINQPPVNNQILELPQGTRKVTIEL